MSKFSVCIVHDTRLPVVHYGGTERVLGWLAKGLLEAGVLVRVACQKGSLLHGVSIHAIDFKKPIPPQLPRADIYHFFFTPPEFIDAPHVITIHGNGRVGERFSENTIFVSRNHALRHQSQSFVYNGVDPNESRFEEKKGRELIFLGKASWKVKNVRGAIRIAKQARQPLEILGGSHPLSFWHRTQGIFWRGMVGGELKRTLVAEASALLFPVLWHEPFGIAVIEALVSGTPVLASPFGSLPELVPNEVGRLCYSESEFVSAVSELGKFSPKACRDWAMSQFHYQAMTKNYLEKYERVLGGEKLNPVRPEATQTPEFGCVLAR